MKRLALPLLQFRAGRGVGERDGDAVITKQHAEIIVYLIQALEENTDHGAIVAAMKDAGFSEKEVDRALKSLGEMAGVDSGWL